MKKTEELPKIQREPAIDIAKGIAILCMVYAHMVTEWERPDTIIIYSFHMPVFILISGYFFKDESVKVTLRKKISGIYMPYLVIGILSILVGVFVQLYVDGGSMRNAAIFFVGHSYNLLIGYQTWVLWFLLSLFVTSVLFMVILKIARNNLWIRWGLTILLSVAGYYIALHTAFVPFYLDAAMASLVFIAAGYELKLHKEFFWEKCFGNPFVSVALLVLWVLGMSGGRFDIVFEIYPNYPLCMIGAVAGSLMLIMLSKRVAGVPLLLDFLVYCGRNTLPILAVHNVLRRYCAWQDICGGVNAFQQFLLQMMLIIACCVIWNCLKAFVKAAFYKCSIVC